MATLYSSVQITSETPRVVSTVTYDYARSGTRMHYWGTVEMHVTSSAGWRNNRWAVCVYVNGSTVGSNITVKPRTSGVIGLISYYGNFDGWIDVGSSAGGTAWMSVHYIDTGFSTSWSVNVDWGTHGGNVPISYLPTTYVSLNSRGINNLSLNWWTANLNAEKVQIYNGSSLLGEFTSTPANVTGLTANTTYSDLKAYGYGNGMYGPVGNSISAKTYPSTVSVSSVSTSVTSPFACTVSCVSSNSSTTNLIEYSILDSNGTVIKGPVTSTDYSYSFTELDPESTYTAQVRMRTSDSGYWSSYSTATFRTLTDQVQGWIKRDGVWSRGKVFIKDSSGWQPAKHAYGKVSGSWRETTND